jgi:hypothetical protein
MPDPVEPGSLDDWKAIAEAQSFIKEQYMADNRELRRQIYRLTHQTPRWKRIVLTLAVRLMKRD